MINVMLFRELVFLGLWPFPGGLEYGFVKTRIEMIHTIVPLCLADVLGTQRSLLLTTSNVLRRGLVFGFLAPGERAVDERGDLRALNQAQIETLHVILRSPSPCNVRTEGRNGCIGDHTGLIRTQ